MYKIYIVRNRVNGKIYIGLTYRTVEQRWREHCRDCFAKKKLNIRFYNALRKYGKSAFEIEQIDSAPNKKTAGLLESAYILMYYAYVPEFGYNGTFGGEGIIPTPETKARMGTKKGWKHTPQAIAKIAAASKRPMRESTKRKLSEARKGPGNPMFGKKGHYYPEITVAHVQTLRDSGLSIRAIAMGLGVSRNVVYDRLGTKTWN